MTKHATGNRQKGQTTELRLPCSLEFFSQSPQKARSKMKNSRRKIRRVDSGILDWGKKTSTKLEIFWLEQEAVSVSALRDGLQSAFNTGSQYKLLGTGARGTLETKG